MPPFYKIKQSPESLRDTSWILCQEAKPGFKPRSDSQLPVLRNGDFFCLGNIFRHEPKHFQGIQCKKPENTKGEKSNSGELEQLAAQRGTLWAWVLQLALSPPQ